LTDHIQHAEKLLAEWALCKHAKPRGDAISLQIERDELERWAQHLSRNITWDPDTTSTHEAVYQFEYRLQNYKEKVIFEILKHGTI
jgi:hypothetical protein